ncbi:hypothetical protein BZA77DRAFT_310394 [Pyronema omphalodes]|nr:hypothetical protein BZA77DRAFT_310394 [Pyronema omphalodes]
MSVAVDSDDEDQTLESLTRSLTMERPPVSPSLSPTVAVCCCGSDSCESLRKTQTMLQDLENQMRIAGTLGKALLNRHERSMAEAESREREASNTISKLEETNSKLEAENLNTKEENEKLIEALERLTSDMVLSELRVKELQQDLDATHAELSRVSAHAARTAVLEAQLAVLESEQAELRNTIATTREEEIAARHRWQRAEKQLAELENQLDRILQEHNVEKVRSENIRERLEQRKLQLQREGNGSNPMADKGALSRFMKEILAENGHLQLGIAELRDLLAQSQEEVDKLRHQLENFESSNIQHAPLPDRILSPSLSMELATGATAAAAGAAISVVHHHHHYPTPAAPKQLHQKPRLRPKKKRTPAVEHLNALRIKNLESSGPSSAPSGSKRWSTSTGAYSSSPPSSFRESSIFDRYETEDASSRPTSVDSNYPPPWPKKPTWGHARYPSNAPPPFTILHTTEEISESSEPSGSPIVGNNGFNNTGFDGDYEAPRPALRRMRSHDSILSIKLDQHQHHQSLAPPGEYLSATLSVSRKSSGSFNTPIVQRVEVGEVHSNFHVSIGAYDRLRGLQEARRRSSGVSGTNAAAGSEDQRKKSGWFWKYVTLAPGGWKPGREERPQTREGDQTTKKKVAVEVLDEELLRESLVDGPGLS